jgi:type 1 fimbria pilin
VDRANLRQALRRVAFGALTTLGLAVWGPAPSAHAATGNVTFYGNINSTSSCQVIVNNHGTLGVSGNVRQLSSKIAGGGPGRVTILQAGVYSISASTLPAFSVAPVGGDAGVTRQVLFNGVATNLITGFSLTIPERNGTPGIRVNSFGMRSRVNLDINFIANRPTAYPSGPYEAIVVVRCE